jgi:hypothetical protein
MTAMVAASALTAFGEDSNILYPIDEIEQMLKHQYFDIFRISGSRFKEDLTKRAILKFPVNKMVQVKWKRSAEDGWQTNNEPRYEIAAYEIQKLFLDPDEFIVPPTAARVLPISQYKRIEPGASPTFRGTQDVIYVLQYWLERVSTDDIYDKKRFESDLTYAKHLANMNILAYLIDHKDSNKGNFLISTDPDNPRVFAVDNGFAFESPKSKRGTYWRKIQVKKLPKKTVDRLRGISRQDLDEKLGVVAQFEMNNRTLNLVESTAKLDKHQGVHRSGNIIQFGLREREIDGVARRLNKLLEQVDSGKIKTFEAERT